MTNDIFLLDDSYKFTIKLFYLYLLLFIFEIEWNIKFLKLEHNFKLYSRRFF